MSLFKSLGNFVKDIIPGKIDDALIDTITKGDTLGKIKEGFFPSSKSSSQSQGGESFFNLRCFTNFFTSYFSYSFDTTTI